VTQPLILKRDILVSNFAFKRNFVPLYATAYKTRGVAHRFLGNWVGLCTLNQVDPYPIAYNLSNP
jgi:hypothetical protein